MAEYKLSDLYDKYEGFTSPAVRVYLGGKNPEEDKKIKLHVAEVTVEVTSDFKASIATVSITGGFSNTSGTYDTQNLKKYVNLGNSVKVFLGHAASIMEVFVGYIARVDFIYLPELGSTIRLTAMDVKGIMMANNSSKRLKANYYSDAVSEIFEKAPYQNLVNSEIITSIDVSDTPDKPQGGAGGGEPPDIRIEMVAESDYDFIVRAAKKFNFEFFSIGGHIAFRKAKANTQELIEIVPSTVIVGFDIGYDITGVVGEVKVRTIDIGKGSKIEVRKKNTGKFSLGSKAKPLVSGQAYIYTDSSIETQSDADRRATYIMEDMSYRLGSLSMTVSGMPEIVPGRFIILKDFGDGISNKYYVTDVIHEYTEGNYTTTIEGKASTL